MPDLGGDLPDDDERVGGLLKSLINTKGLQTTWQSVLKRLQALEQGLRRVQQTMDRLSQHYVNREEFHDLVETQHAKLLRDHDIILKQNEETIQKLRSTDSRQHNPQPFLASLEIQKELEQWVQTKLDEVETLSHDFRAEVMHQMQTTSGMLSKNLDKLALNAEQLKQQVEDSFASAAHLIHETEHNMQISTEQKIDRMIQNLCYNKASPEAEQLLSLVSKSLVAPLANDITRAGGEIHTLTQNFAKQKKSFVMFQESQTQAMSKMVAMLQDTSKELKEQLDLCSAKVDADRTKQELNHELGALYRETDDLRSTIQDHEWRLQHHTEEIKSRSTQREVLNKCASKDEFHRELGELKKIMSWQSGKIEKIGLSGLSMGQGKHLRHGRRKLHSRRSSADGESSSEASNGGTSSVAHQPIILRPKLPNESEESVQPALGNLEEADEVTAEYEPQGVSSPALLGDSGDDDVSSEYSVSSSTHVLRQQLEAISMGVLGLAHLSLKEVRLGTSRTARLAQEKEILEELANVRHWITNKVVPSGWDPSKITTVALRCTHPREDEMKGPTPQVSLKNLLEQNDESRMLHKRNLSLDPRSGGKLSGESVGDVANKPPLSVRGHPGATRLPPLEGLMPAN